MDKATTIVTPSNFHFGFCDWILLWHIVVAFYSYKCSNIATSFFATTGFCGILLGCLQPRGGCWLAAWLAAALLNLLMAECYWRVVAVGAGHC